MIRKFAVVLFLAVLTGCAEYQAVEACQAQHGTSCFDQGHYTKCRLTADPPCQAKEQRP